MTDDFHTAVPHEELTPARKRECCEIMRRGNSLYRKYLPHISMYRSRKCRRMVIDGHAEKVLAFIPEERHDEFRADVPTILEVESVIPDMIGCNVKMIVKLAIRYAKSNSTNAMQVRKSYLEGNDFVSEGFMAMIDAIHNYDRDAVGFLTYAWNVVNRRLFVAMIESSPSASFSRSEQKLLQTFIKSEIKKGRKPSLAKAVADKAMDECEAAVVREMLGIKVMLASTLESYFQSDRESSFDYTSIRAGVARDAKGRPIDSWELYDLIERARLNQLEQDALLSSMTPCQGWQVECARRHKRQGHDKNISKTTVANALKQAVSKIRDIADGDAAALRG